MQTSDKGRAFIAAHEGIVTRAYRDVAGVWTIGVGHTAAAGPPAPKAGMTISRAEALAILAADLPRYERRVAAALPGRRSRSSTAPSRSISIPGPCIGPPGCTSSMPDGARRRGAP